MDYSTIQAAINAAQSADTVFVSEGTYFENIYFNDKSIVATSNYIFLYSLHYGFGWLCSE